MRRTNESSTAGRQVGIRSISSHLSTLAVRTTSVAACGALMVLATFVAGCQTPFDSPDDGGAFRQAVSAAVDRELGSLGEAAAEQVRVADRGPTPVEEALSKRRDELEAMNPYSASDRDTYSVGDDLTGQSQDEVSLGLDAAVVSAVTNNFSARDTRIGPALSQADRIAAEAAFDFVLFGSASASRTDQPTSVPIIGGVPIGTAARQSRQYQFQFGANKRFDTGGTLELSTDLSRTRDLSAGLTISPDPALAPSIRAKYTQPLMRGFGREVNTAEIRIAANAEDRAVEQVRADLLVLVDRIDSTYWDLVLAWETLAIRQWLVDEGEKVRAVLEARQAFDTKLAEYAEAVAALEQRKADVIRARRTLRLASDALKVLMNDPQLSVASESLIKPTKSPVATPMSFSLRNAILTAVTNRPEVEQAVLAIDDARVRQVLADNARLPLLNLAAEMAYFGLDDSIGDAYDDIGNGSFIDYIVGANFEYPIGNRAAEAQFSRARLQRSSELLKYQQAVQRVIVDVKNALRDVATNFELIAATRSSRVAQAENLRALQAEEETMASLTPSFLDLKLRRQESLAGSRLQEIAASVDFSKAVSSLNRALGTSLQSRGVALDIVDISETDNAIEEVTSWPGDGS